MVWSPRLSLCRVDRTDLLRVRCVFLIIFDVGMIRNSFDRGGSAGFGLFGFGALGAICGVMAFLAAVPTETLFSAAFLLFGCEMAGRV